MQCSRVRFIKVQEDANIIRKCTLYALSATAKILTEIMTPTITFKKSTFFKNQILKNSVNSYSYLSGPTGITFAGIS